MLLIPYHLLEESFVRWVPVTAQSGDAAPIPAVGATGAPPADVPSAHVGIFEATNGAMWSKVKVTNLDGLDVNTYARLPGVPIAMAPGTHWVQVGVETTHWMPLRDVDTKYAFELDAVAGHRYRIPTRPSSCLAPGNVDAALASSSVYHAQLPIIDETSGAPARTFSVEALCVSAKTYVCEAPAAGTVALAEGGSCVRLAGWNRGYFGNDAGAVPPQ